MAKRPAYPARRADPEEFLKSFPTVRALAGAPLAAAIQVWGDLGRRVREGFSDEDGLAAVAEERAAYGLAGDERAETGVRLP